MCHQNKARTNGNFPTTDYQIKFYELEVEDSINYGLDAVTISQKCRLKFSVVTLPFNHGRSKTTLFLISL